MHNAEDFPHCVALLIAAPASGQGKTTVTAALARHWVRQGLRVRVFKCGPDFLDPHWLELASGAAVDNVDMWMVGAQLSRQRLYEAARDGAQVLLIEGVMGLFDGQPHSSAALAQALGVPVLAVVDAAAMSATFGALEWGLRTYVPDLPWAGVLANRVAHEAHERLIHASLKPCAQWLGALPSLKNTASASKTPTSSDKHHQPAQKVANDLSGVLPHASSGQLLPHRHLGLVSAAELPDALQRLDRAADAIAQTPLGQLDAAELQQRWGVRLRPADVADVPACAPWLAGRTVAIARDAAFSFIYPTNVQCLRAMGAHVVFFSPLAGDALPACDALWLPGGYPELHAQRLSQRTDLAAAIAEHAAAGRAVWAECGGMLVLGRSLRLADGSEHRMWGMLEGVGQMQPRLKGLGKRGWIGPMGLRAQLRGHTFHYSHFECAESVLGWALRPELEAAQQAQTPDSSFEQKSIGCVSAPPSGAEAIYERGCVRASYFHPWFYSCPQAVAWLMGGVDWDAPLST